MADTPKVYVLCDANCRWEGMTKEQILTAIEQAVSTGEIGDIDTGFVQTIKTINGVGLKFYVGTQTDYDLLSEEDKQNLFAIITDDITKDGVLNAFETLQNSFTEMQNHFNKVMDGTETVGKATIAEGVDFTEAIYEDKNIPVVLADGKGAKYANGFEYNPDTRELKVRSISGNAASVGVDIDATTDRLLPILYVAGGGEQTPKASSGLRYNPVTKTLKVPNIEIDGKITADDITETEHAQTADRATEADRADDLRIVDVSTLEDINNIIASGKSCAINLKADIYIDYLTFPKWSKGWLSTANDAVISVIDTSGITYTAYRSGTTWRGARKSTEATIATHMQRNIKFNIKVNSTVGGTVINIVYYSGDVLKNMQRVITNDTIVTMSLNNVDMGSLLYFSTTNGSVLHSSIPAVFRADGDSKSGGAEATNDLNTLLDVDGNGEVRRYLNGRTYAYTVCGGGSAFVQIL